MRVWMVIAAGCASASGQNGLNGKAGQEGDEGANGADGQQGATGPAGPQGPAGAPGGSYRWHDATGAQVTEGESPQVWVDGVLWTIYTETGEPFVSSPLGILFTEPDCQGTEYVSAFSPRQAVNGLNWGEPDEFYVRPDTLVSGEEDIQSWFYNESCLPYPTTARVLRLSSLTPIGAPPSWGWVGPLHPEPIE